MCSARLQDFSKAMTQNSHLCHLLSCSTSLGSTTLIFGATESLKIIDDISFDKNETLSLYSDFELINKILFDDKEIKNTWLLFGHSAWEKSQLDNEIKNGDWLVHDSSEVVFEKNPKTLWRDLIKLFGFDKFKMTGISGVS